jgi:hypothetical protein
MNSPMAPQSRIEIPNYTNYQPQEELVRLRKRVSDLMRLGAATPETFVQTVMQLFQEGERRRQGCMTEAEDHLRKYHALIAQAHGFSAMSSVLYSVINGFATLEERRIQEMEDRAKERAENGPPAAADPPPAPIAVAPPAPQEVKVEAKPPGNHKPSGGKRKKP